MLSALPLFSQHYTYIGGGMNLNTATRVSQFGPFDVSNVIELDGGSYDISIRQEINDLVSLETGLSHHNYGQNFLINGRYEFLGGFESIRLPIKIELEVAMFKDKHNFFYMQGAITYPVQRIADGIRWVAGQLEY